MKTIRWKVLKKKIKGLQDTLESIIGSNPDFDESDIAESLNQIFSKELKKIGTTISEYHVQTALKRRSYKKVVSDFIQELSDLEPDEIAKIFQLRLPVTSLDKPVFVEANPDNPRAFFINAPMIGLGKDNDVLKRELITAQHRRSDVVVLPGNLVWLDLIRYSNIKPKRAQFSWEDEQDNIVFRPFKQKFDTLVNKLRKQFFDERGSPYFKGKIIIALGKTEQDLVQQYTNEIIRRVTMKAQRELREELSTLKKEREQAKEDEERMLAAALLEEIEAVEKKLSYVIMTNTNEGYLRKISKEMQKYIIYVYEKALNAKVVSSGEFNLNVGGLTFKVDIDIKDSPRDSIVKRLLGRYRTEAKTRDIPHIICAAGRTNQSHAGSPVSFLSQKKTVAVSLTEQLPCGIDNRSIKSTRTEIIRSGDTFIDAVSVGKLVPGAVFYQGIRERKSGELIIRRETYGLSFFLNDALFNAKNWQMSKIAFWELEGDPHMGSPFITHYAISRSPWFRYFFQIAHDFLQFIHAPIVAYVNYGDIIQGHNPKHKFETSLPKEVESPTQLISRFDKTRLSNEDFFTQIIKRGILPSEDQITEYVDAAFNGYEDYFLGIIKRANKAGIKFMGDLAPIIFLGGNHYMNTTEGEANEGVAVARSLRDRLSSKIRNGNPKDLIKSPRFGKEPIGRGIIKFPNGAEFAIVVRHKQIYGASKYDDPMQRIIPASQKRGVYDAIEQGRFVFNFSGHTHMGGFGHTNDAVFEVGGSQTYHDPYGDRIGFPLNFIASLIEGMPQKGLEWGPIVRIILDHSFFEKTKKHWMEWDIDRKVLFELA